LFNKFKKQLKENNAKRKVAAYENRYQNADASIERPAPLPVEETFDAFVEQFGGEKISNLIQPKAQMPLNADYFFRDHNVIAELKTLEGVYSGPDAYKSLSQAFIDAGCSESDFMGLLLRGEDMPELVRDLVGRRIRRSIEQRIKKARKQLRQSRATYGDANTRALILIAMDQQPLFGHRTMLLHLAKVMGDNYADEHTDGVVYLNPNIPTKLKADGMEFSGWYPFYRDDQINDEFSEFVNLLGNRWLTFYGIQIGQLNPILELDSPEEMLAVLRGH
jgi:hypothetical protein